MAKDLGKKTMTGYLHTKSKTGTGIGLQGRFLKPALEALGGGPVFQYSSEKNSEGLGGQGFSAVCIFLDHQPA